MESDFSLCTASVGMVAFQGLAWIKQITDLGLLEHSRISASFAAPSLFLNTGEALGNIDSKGVLQVDKPSSHWWDKNPGERLRA